MPLEVIQDLERREAAVIGLERRRAKESCAEVPKGAAEGILPRIRELA